MIGTAGCVESFVQVSPPSVERNTPPRVRANSVVPLPVRERMFGSAGCVAAAVQQGLGRSWRSSLGSSLMNHRERRTLPGVGPILAVVSLHLRDTPLPTLD